ncbi:hypothetical protein [Brumimicrobium mesophilum]|uniref:hypothetical protein n=1 Tax=Brumimicrobium mesophilum TaxID=392717 RepID=UPI00131D779F|nr:hypothetical protein [Brumimicrobium mesophilum]
MYKILLLFVFFSLVSVAQVETPTRNQNNSIEVEKKSNKIIQELEEVETESIKAKPFASQREVFLSNVNTLQTDLRVLSLSTTSKTPTDKQQKQLEIQLKEVKRLNANSFEYHLLNYQVGNYDFSRVESLKKAEKINPNDAALLKEFSAYSYIMNNEKDLVKYLRRLNSQRVFSSDLDVYATNVLKSLPTNSVVLSHGESDTYPMLIQQKINNVRNDVEIISLDHLQSKEYRNRLQSKGFKIPKREMVDTEFFKIFIQMNSTKNIIVAGSVPQPYLKNGKQINTVGLGFSFDRKNDVYYNLNYYENTLKNEILNHVAQAKDGQILANYLPYLFSVRNDYIFRSDLKNVEDMQELEKLIILIGQKSNKINQVKALLKK